MIVTTNDASVMMVDGVPVLLPNHPDYKEKEEIKTHEEVTEHVDGT